MITPVQKPKRKRTTPPWHTPFLAMLPKILRQANIATKHMRGEARQDLIAEILASTVCAFARLAAQGKLDVAFPSVLVQHAVKRYFEGRRTGTPLNAHDVLTEYGRGKNGSVVESLEQIDPEEDDWRQWFLEDRRATPADLVRSKVDFAQWLDQLPSQSRKVACYLGVGNTTNDAARRFGVSAVRISRYRRRLKNDWDRFHGDVATEDPAG